MMSSSPSEEEEELALEDLLYGRRHGHEPEGAELGRGPPAGEKVEGEEGGTSDSADNTPAQPPEPQVCAGCGEQVCDRFLLLAVGRAWHGACLRCSQCGCELQTHPSLYCREGSIYCQQDYCRLFGIGRCSRCAQPIPSSAMVMRAGELIFHPHCFSCQECDVKLMPGNLYCMQGQHVYCQSHYHGNGSALLSEDPHNKANLTEGEGEDSVSSPEPRLDERLDERPAGGQSRRRTKRIRTCFRSEQLRALESYFAQKHNPDGKDWTCLAHKTGLPKRVLQVWFQNARAKLRRSLSTDDPHSRSPAPPLRAETPATDAHRPDQSQPFLASTIDQLQLALLTRPLCSPTQSPPAAVGNDQSGGPSDSSFFLADYDSQGAPGCISPLMAYEDFGGCVEGAGGGEEGSDAALGPYYC